MGEERLALSSPPGLGAEAVDLLSRLLRMNTVNPPGNELPAQELLADTLAGAGFACELLAAVPGRPNLVARLEGEAPGSNLCILGHVDTVPADPEDWSFDPWSGDVVAGEVRGRGAQDMKGQVAPEVAACAALARSGWRPPAGDLLVVITADEEAGAEVGAQWLCRDHADRVRCEWVINEGAGTAIDFRGRRVYPVSVGEKGVFRFLLRARGEAGHASMPGLGENALLKLLPYLERLRRQPRHDAEPEALTLLERLGEPVGADGVEAALARVRDTEPLVAAYVEPMLGVTLVPTKARASEKDNVTPALAEVLVDCRVPPGMTEPEVGERVRAVIGEGDYEVEFVENVVGSKSSAESALYDAIEAWVERLDPAAALSPMVMPGFSDSHWFRKAFDATAYGFCPQAGMTLTEVEPLVHGADERIRASDVELAARFFFEIVPEVLA